MYKCSSCKPYTRPSPLANTICCPKYPSPGSAIPESSRITSNANACIQPLISTATIVCNGEGTNKQAYLSIVADTTIPASVITKQAATRTLKNESDPYDPATRFNKYFRPVPPPPPCPERLPSIDPKPSTAPCIPIVRFQGSAIGR